jgi:heme exporter protein A
MPETGLKVDDLGVWRGGQPVVAGVGFSLAPRMALEVRGPNGAGKSTLLMALAGLIRPETGTIAWSGMDDETEPRTLLHYCGHQPAIKPGLSLRENIAFWTDVLGGAENSVAPALDAAGLGAIANLDAGVLSAGQTRRLALARLLAVPRPVWLLDEPTSALDADGARRVGAMISDHCEKGGIAVIATHVDIDYGSGFMPQHLGLGAGP